MQQNSGDGMSKINDLEEQDLGPISLDEEDLAEVIIPESTEIQKKKKRKDDDDTPIVLDEDDPNNLPIALERIKAGLVGTLLIKDQINRPMIKRDDLIHFRQSVRIERGDFVLYCSHDEYFIRRVIKFEGLNIYVAGDDEAVYHIIRKEDIIAKGIGRQRGTKYLSFALDKRKNRFYLFKKINMAGMRIKKVFNYDDDQNQIALQNAMENIKALETEKVQQENTDVVDFDMDAELKGFINPDYLAREVEVNRSREISTVVDAVYNEKEFLFEEKVKDNSDVEYVDENGNPVEVDENGNPIYLDENGNRIMNYEVVDDESNENQEAEALEEAQVESEEELESSEADDNQEIESLEEATEETISEENDANTQEAVESNDETADETASDAEEQKNE